MAAAIKSGKVEHIEDEEVVGKFAVAKDLRIRKWIALPKQHLKSERLCLIIQ